MLPYLAALAASLLAVFHGELASHFTHLLGDRYDGLIQTAILEHWYNVLRGLEPWDTTAYFAPYTGTLAYNDGYLLYGPPYAALRALGADPFLANAGVELLLRIVGFAAMEWLLRTALRLPRLYPLLGAALFTLSGNMEAAAGHGQLLSVAFVPLFAGLAWHAGRAARRQHWRHFLLWSAPAALLMATWLLTAYYIAWFTLLTAATCAAIAAATSPRATLALLRRPAALASFATLAATFLLATLPFLLVYLPKARQTGMHAPAFVFYYTTNLLDLIHIPPGHPLLSPLDTLLQSTLRPRGPTGDEHATGTPLPLFILFVLAAATLWRRRADPALRPLALATAATLLVWLATIRFGAWALWLWIYALVPGAKALRVVVRYQLVATATVIPAALWFLAQARLRRPTLALLALLLLAEEITLAPPLNLDRPQELARLQAVPPPPASCRTFAVTRARPAPPSEFDSIYSHNVDAMLLAEYLHLPTINGFSTFNPPDWDFVAPDRPDYPARVQAYATAHHLDALCTLDLQSFTWSPPATPLISSPPRA